MAKVEVVVGILASRGIEGIMTSEEAQSQLERLLDLPDPDMEAIESIIREQCAHHQDGYLFSGFIGIFAEAIRALCDCGKYKLRSDNGGRDVYAEKIK